MGIRETLNNRRSVVYGVTIGVIFVSIASIYLTQHSPNSSSPGEAAYTTDDGKTWFTDVGDRITPFVKDGQTAVTAVLFSNDGGKTKFVGYVQRYDPAAIQKLSKPNADRMAELPGGEAVELMYSLQVKRPQSPTTPWIRGDDPSARDITQVKASGGVLARNVEP